MSDSTTAPSYTVPNLVTDDDHGSWVTVVTAILMSWMVLTMLMRVAIRLRFNGPWGVDDTVAGVGSVFALANSIAIFVSVGQGFGSKTALLSAADETHVSKSLFASQILYILAMALSKISTALLISRLTRLKKHRLATMAVSGVTGAWAVAAILAVCLRCDLSAPWSFAGGAQCVSPFTRWLGVEIVSMAIELLLFGLAIFLVWGLQMSRHLKLIVVGAFMCRPLVVVTLAVRVYYLRPVYFNRDPFFNGVNAAILTQVCMHYALMAATIPCTRPFITAFHSGYMDPEGYTAGSAPGTKQQGSQNGMGSAAQDADRRQSAIRASIFRSDKDASRRTDNYSNSQHPLTGNDARSNDSSGSSTHASAYPVRRLSNDNKTEKPRAAPPISVQRAREQANGADSSSTASPTSLFARDTGVRTTIEHNPHGRQGPAAQPAAAPRRNGQGAQDDLTIRQTREYEVSYEPA